MSLPDLETSGVSCVPKLPNWDEVVFSACTSGRPLGITMAGYPVGAYERLTLAGRGIPTLIHLYRRSIIIIDPSIEAYRLHKKTHYKGCNGRSFPRFGRKAQPSVPPQCQTTGKKQLIHFMSLIVIALILQSSYDTSPALCPAPRHLCGC